MIAATRLLLHLFLVRPLFNIVFGANVVGRRNLVGLDNFVLYANHNSHLDIFLLFLTLPHNQINKTHPLAAYDYFKKPFWLYKIVNFLFQPIWVDRKASGVSVIREVQKKLDQKHSIIIFPEGTRGETPEILEFKGGIGLIAQKNLKTPIIPVYLEGPERVFPKKVYCPIPLCNHITVSPPQIVTGKTNDITSELYRNLVNLSEEEQALRQRRPISKRKPLIVSIIGIDGSGKSTLSKQLCNHLQGECCFIGDNIELFKNGVPYTAQPLVRNEIRMWIGKKAKEAKNLTNYKVPKIAELLLRDQLFDEVTKWYRPDIIFSDGSPLLNMVAWAYLYHENSFDEQTCLKAIELMRGKEKLSINDELFKKYPELKAFRQLNLTHLNLPDIIFFLDIEPEVSIDRISARGEKFQAHENIEKLTKLRSAYVLVCNVLDKLRPVCRLNAEDNLEQLCNEAKKIILDVSRRENAKN